MAVNFPNHTFIKNNAGSYSDNNGFPVKTTCKGFGWLVNIFKKNVKCHVHIEQNGETKVKTLYFTKKSCKQLESYDNERNAKFVPSSQQDAQKIAQEFANTPKVKFFFG